MSNKKSSELLRAIKFALFSLSAGIVQTVSFTVLNEIFKLSYSASYLTALILSVLWNFTFNRKFTFKSASHVPVAMLKTALFYVVFTPLSTWWGDALTKVGVNEYIVLIGTMAINLVTEFLYQRFFVFGKTIDTAVKEKTE